MIGIWGQPSSGRTKRRACAGGALLTLALLLPGAPAGAAPAGADDAERAVPGNVLVGFAPASSNAQRRAAANRVQAASRQKVALGTGAQADVELLRLSAGGPSNARAIELLEREPGVAFAEPNWRYRTTAIAIDPYYTNGSLWGMYGNQTLPANQYGSQAGEAWAAGRIGSDSVYVGVIDEGIQFTHPDLDANAWTNPFDLADGVDNDGNGYVDDLHGWDFAGKNNTVYDGGKSGNSDDHGTHVTGTIGAEGNGSGVVGVNWNVTYVCAKFLARSGGTTANAIKAVDYITDLKARHGLNIVATNNSWGGGGYSQGLRDAISRANARNILFIAAAGNDARNTDSTPNYPSGYDLPNVISVAAIGSSGALASFSNYGSSTVDLGAPGSGIWSTTAFNRYSSYSGTSMAAPHVTGAAALYASTHPGATAAQIKGAILGSVIPTSSLAGKTSTGGRLDAAAAAGQ